MNRLPQPEHTTPGHHWEVLPAPTGYLRWRIGGEGKRCRYGSSPGHKACGRPAVAQLDRGHGSHNRWYAYCDLPGHMYAYWIEDGRVVSWVLRPDVPKPAEGLPETMISQ
jgi:hypothetical protein